MRAAADGVAGIRLRALIVTCGEPDCGSQRRCRGRRAILTQTDGAPANPARRVTWHSREPGSCRSPSGAGWLWRAAGSAVAFGERGLSWNQRRRRTSGGRTLAEAASRRRRESTGLPTASRSQISASPPVGSAGPAPPTAVQCEAERHETPVRSAPPVNARPGWCAHRPVMAVPPLRDRVLVAADEEWPTAVHELAELHDTPCSPAKSPWLGGCRLLQR